MRLLHLGLLAAALSVAQPVNAQEDYPSQPVHITVGYSPGGVTDTSARTLAQSLQEKLGQPVVVDNRPGGGGVLGVETVAGANPDGYTLLMATNAETATSPALQDDLPYDMDEDLVPITLVNDTPLLLIANADSQFDTIEDVVAQGGSDSAEIAYGTPAVGSSHHLLGEAIANEAGLNMLHIPYPGGSPTAIAVASGEVPLGIVGIASALPHIEAGRVVPIAVSSAERSDVLPDTPTLVEGGLDLQTSLWIGLFAPAGTPDAIVEKLNTVVNEVLAQPNIAEKFAAGGAVPMGSTPEELTERRRVETEWSRSIAEEANISLE